MSCKVSIIVPVYNVEKYLHRCLTSLVNQTLKDIEIIIVNDGSTDNSSQIIEEFAQKDTRIKIINQENSKLGATRNNGLKLTTGEYIGYVDSDDYVDENFFEELYNTAKKYDADIVSTNILKHKPRFCKYNIKYNEYKTTKDIQEKIKLCSDKTKRFFYCWNKIYRKSFIEQNNFQFTEKRIHEDIIFSLKALYYSNILAVTPNTKYHYIQNKSSICNTKKNVNTKIIDRIYSYKQMQIFAQNNNIELPERMNYYKSYWSSLTTKTFIGYYKKKETLFGIITIPQYLANILKSLLNIINYGPKLRIFFLGISLYFPKLNTYTSLKKQPYEKYKEQNADIRTLQKATGQVRDIQLANLELLKELDYVCKQNNLKYWLDGGSMLGSIRHKGYIPWDDDIDVGMLREDYEKLKDVFDKTSRNSDIYVEPYQPYRTRNINYYMKVQHKKCPHLFVDIFPVDVYGKKLTKEEQLKETNKIKEKRNKLFHFKNITSLPDYEILQRIKLLEDDILLKANENNSDFVWGVEFKHPWANWFTAYDVIFPLKTIEFEGLQFPSINNPDAYLTRLYGNYMDYPSRIGFAHSAYAKLDEEEKQTIKKLIQKEE